MKYIYAVLFVLLLVGVCFVIRATAPADGTDVLLTNQQYVNEVGSFNE